MSRAVGRLAKPVNGAVFYVAMVLTLLSVLALFMIALSVHSDHSSITGRLAELQLLLYVAFAALLALNADLRRSLRGKTPGQGLASSAALMLMTITCLLAPSIPFVFGGAACLERVLGLLSFVTILSIALLLNDAIRDSDEWDKRELRVHRDGQGRYSLRMKQRR